ncbi:MAG: gamma-glutamyltransferase [Myxococcota bacterium]|nr:gamma-glutamyltransferase [Myxococcota bacterium]
MTARPPLWIVWLALALEALVAAAGHAAAPAPARSPLGMVVTPHPEATRAGLEMLEAGGNAIDAAVAAAFSLGVTQPQSTGIGGGAFILVRLADGSTFALDARETAPAASTPDMYTQEGLPERPSLLGGLASGVPGMVAGLSQALETWGSLPLAKTLAPAIRSAEEGYEIGGYQAAFVERFSVTPSGAEGFAGVYAEALRTRFLETARIQLLPLPIGPRSVLQQPELGGTLRAIAKDGPKAFYQGEIAEAIAKAAQATGGILTAEDLAAYQTVMREPVRGVYRGHEILSFPPPSSGGVALVEILNILEGFDLAADGAGDSASIHRIAEAMKLAFADRAAHLGDPDFVEVPTERLLDKSYAALLRGRIRPEAVARVEGSGLAPDDQGTAHLSVTDAAGNAVAITGTINAPFGSLVTVPGTGILLNNEMDDFVTDPKGANFYGLVGTTTANQVEPGKRPLSSMSPTIVLKGGKLRAVAGSNGGPRIITATLLALVNVIDYEMDAFEAVSQPRFHHQWRPDVLTLEEAHPADVVDALRRRGHEVKTVEELVTGVQLIVVDPVTGIHTGAPDPRRDGLAQGPLPPRPEVVPPSAPDPS